jgi:hypothetical protein
MKVPKKLQEIFDSQARECSRLVAELEEHNKTWPEVKSEFDRIDREECIVKARSVNDARSAGSPTYYALEGELKRSRWKRDGIASAFRRRRDELQTEIEKFTGEPIRNFHNDCLDRVKNLSKLYHYERDEKIYNVYADAITVRIRHNGAALDDAKNQIFEALKEVQGMRHSALSALKEKIEFYREQFDDFDFSTMEAATVSEQAARDMAPGKPDSTPAQSGMFMPDGSIHLFAPPADAARLNSLSDRLSKLEKI